ncbi:MAG: polysaccharide deacetylase family protein [Draconibacterium sp.]
MAQFSRYISKQISHCFPAPKLFRATTPLFLPFYHTVSNNTLKHVTNYPYRNEKDFEQELDYILKYFEPVSLEDVYKNTTHSKPVFHLSFDDGLRECSEVIAPVLLKKGIPASFFVNTGFVNNKALFHRYKASILLNELLLDPDSETENFLKKNGLPLTKLLQAGVEQTPVLDEAAEMMYLDFNMFLKKYKPYLTTSQIKTLHEQGFSIGGHSHEHSEFWNLPKKKQLKEIATSMDWITSKINPKIKAFAFPYTDHGVSGKILKKAVEDQICDITFGTAGLKHDSVPTHFQRVPMETGGPIETNLKTEFVYYKLRKFIGKATVRH